MRRALGCSSGAPLKTYALLTGGGRCSSRRRLASCAVPAPVYSPRPSARPRGRTGRLLRQVRQYTVHSEPTTAFAAWPNQQPSATALHRSNRSIPGCLAPGLCSLDWVSEVVAHTPPQGVGVGGGGAATSRQKRGGGGWGAPSWASGLGGAEGSGEKISPAAAENWRRLCLHFFTQKMRSGRGGASPITRRRCRRCPGRGTARQAGPASPSRPGHPPESRAMVPADTLLPVNRGRGRRAAAAR